MRTTILSLLLLLVAAPALSATENDPAADDPRPQVVTVEEAQPEPAPGDAMRLDQIDLERRDAPTDEAAAVQLGPPGSFWWLVGVVVVAGIILAVVL